MACFGIRPTNVDSEMEEGEIVDEVDYLSDISSEEEFLLRQRLKVLENYNNALERKEAKKTSLGSGKKHGNTELNTEADDDFLKTTFVISKEKKHAKLHNRQKRLKSDNGKHRKKPYRRRKLETVSESDDSELSDDDYKNKRRKLADAVSLNIVRNDTSTLKERLTKMLCISKAEKNKLELPNATPKSESIPQDIKASNEKENKTSELNCKEAENLIDMCVNEVSKAIQNDNNLKDIDKVVVEDKKEELDVNNSAENSDEDLELLRQHALKTKLAKTKDDKKTKVVKADNKTDALSEDEDSDTTELRMICLKSRLLKKAIEIKQKQKLRKRLSNSNMHDFDIICLPENNIQADNNTDTESVDMEIGSDNDNKGKELINDCTHKNNHHTVSGEGKIVSNDCLHREDEIEEDEDLLRAKLLTSLSKNLPNLVDKIQTLDYALNKDKTKPEKRKFSNISSNIEEKKFIIQLGDSESEAENEATKNLTKMHIKLSEQPEFQQQLDLFLKSTRLEVEKNKLPDVVREPAVQNPPPKFVAKTVNHLPKSEQMEYKNLVKRMAELEKMKLTRQNMINMNSRVNNLPKVTLENPPVIPNKLVSIDKIEEKIALSRKRIAQESSNMLKLKDEATNLSQRYKIVATELKNIATAITLNKKQQKTVQNSLNKIRHQHQMLLKSVPNKHSNHNLTLKRFVEKSVPTVTSQTEKEPIDEDHKRRNVSKSLKVTVACNNDKEHRLASPRLSVEKEITHNKKIITVPKSPQKNVDLKNHGPKKKSEERIHEKIISLVDDKESDTYQYIKEEEVDTHKIKDVLDDYKSPLGALQCKNWEEDPNGVLCPFEFGGSCRDPDCKYLHPKNPTQE